MVGKAITSRFKKQKLVTKVELSAQRQAVIDARKERAKFIRKQSTGWAKVGGVAFAVSALATNPSFREGCTTIMHGAGWGTIAGSIDGYNTESKNVRKATKLVGEGLFEEAQKSKILTKELLSKKYVYVDKYGEIILTNRPRVLGIGRIRLDTRKIISGEYD